MNTQTLVKGDSLISCSYIGSTFLLLFVLDFKLFGFGGTGISTQGISLGKKVLYCLRHISSPFCSGYFDALVNYLPGLTPNLSLPSG
jgi:hypothetical protein